METAISRLSRERSVESLGKEEAPPVSEIAVRMKIAKGGKDVSQLVRRFSGSEKSGSEPSDWERSSTSKRIPFTRKAGSPSTVSTKQEIASKFIDHHDGGQEVKDHRSKFIDHHDGGQEVKGQEVRDEEEVPFRRTPERTQSLRERSSPEKEMSKVTTRAQSFRDKGVTMRRRFKSNTPDEELMKILNRRSRNLEEWEAQLSQNQEEGTEAEKAIEAYEQKLEQDKQSKPKEHIIIDNEVMTVLQARRATIKDTDVDANMNAVPSSVQTRNDNKIELTPVQTKSVEMTSILKKPDSSRDLKMSPILKNTSQKETSVAPGIKKEVSDVEMKLAPILSIEQSVPSKMTSSTKIKPTPMLTMPDSPVKKSSITVSAIRKPSDSDSVRKSSKQIMLTRSESLTEEPIVNNKTVSPALKKAKTFDLGNMDPECVSRLYEHNKSDDKDEHESR